MGIDECLDGMVAVSVDMCEEAPQARYFVNDLTGITVKKAGKAANEEVKTGYNLLIRKIEQAKRDMVADVLTNIGIKASGKAIRNNSTAGYLNRGAAIDTAAAGYKGVIFRIHSHDYVELQINNFRLWSPATVSAVQFKVIDLLTGDTLKTVTADVVTGINNVAVNYTVVCTKRDNYYALVFDSSLFNTYTTRFASDSCCPVSAYDCGAGVSVESGLWPSTGGINYNTKLSSVGSHGMSIDYSLMCSAESFVCRNAQMFASALQYKAAALVMMEMRFSTRLNGLTQMTKEGAEELGAYYNDQYREKLDAAFRGISTNSSDCFSCKPKIQVRTLIP